jgi:hypothetical protein
MSSSRLPKHYALVNKHTPAIFTSLTEIFLKNKILSFLIHSLSRTGEYVTAGHNRQLYKIQSQLSLTTVAWNASTAVTVYSCTDCQNSCHYSCTDCHHRCYCLKLHRLSSQLSLTTAAQTAITAVTVYSCTDCHHSCHSLQMHKLPSQLSLTTAAQPIITAVTVYSHTDKHHSCDSLHPRNILSSI